MNERNYTRIIISTSRPRAYYTEQEAAESSHLDIPTIQRLRTIGLIQGVEVVGGGERRYSEEEVERLRRIRRLRRDLGVNLAGVEVILHMLAHLQALQEELEQYKNE